MKLYRYFLLLSTFAVFLFSNAQQTAQLNSSEKILYNAKIFTANTAQPYAEAIAIRGEKIISCR
jgi:hypothetical protein